MTSDPDPAPQTSTPGWWRRLRRFLADEPGSRGELAAALRRASARRLIEPDALAMMEGALRVSELRAADLMVPRAQIKAVDLSETRQVWLEKLISRGHSRFPVIDGDLDTVRGVLHAKDLLRLLVDPRYDITGHLRPARFVPESMPVNLLLRDFRVSRNHLALVIDEFGCVSGLITIEDVIEQVMGPIDDEFDDDVSPELDNIVVVDDEHWRVKAATHLEQFNEYFRSALSDDYCETVGGLITDRFEHVPHRGEVIEVDGFRFRVLKGDERQAKLFLAERVVTAGRPAGRTGDGPADP